MLAAFPLSAGESPYNPGDGSNQAAVNAMKACQPAVNKAAHDLIFLPENDPRRPEIVRELGSARLAMSQGHAQECLRHAQRAAELEKQSS
jgi:hypothetical protein